MNIAHPARPEGGAGDRVVVIGAGAGGLAAAITLAARGVRVTLLEKEATPGGKMRQVVAGGKRIDAGPTVMTMRWIFDDMLAPAGVRLEDIVTLSRAETLARHFWPDGSSLDLFADIDRSAEAIAAFADPRNADGYRRFCADSAFVHDLLRDSYIADQRPGPLELASRIGLLRPGALFALRPFSTLWSALGGYFPDERLRQLFGRYATYVGSSPFAAPATLMLIAHVEQAGVWLVREGMHGLAAALADTATRLGVDIRYGAQVSAIETRDGRVSAVRLADGGSVAAEAVVFNGDVSALAGLVDAPRPRLPRPVPAADRSLSALVWCVRAQTGDAPLAHHTVFFSKDYRAEFDRLKRGQIPVADPTIYICAQDRDDAGRLDPAARDGERLLVLVNAPALGDSGAPSRQEVASCREMVTARLAQAGLEMRSQAEVLTGPEGFDALFPGSGGAIYGRASHGWTASFRRSGARTPIAGLYRAGGSVHPGAGVPMAAMSGRLAAQALMVDSISRPPSRRAAIIGGTPTA